MGEVITKLRIETDEYQNRVRRAAASLNDMGHQCERAGNSIAILNKDNIKLAKSLGSMQTVSTSLRGKMNELSQAFVDASHHYNQLTAAEKRSQYGQYLSKSIDQLKVRLREARTELRGLELEASGGGKHSFMQQFASGLVPGLGMGVGAAAAMAAVRGVMATLNALKNVIKSTIQTNIEFEQANANLAAVLGKTRVEITALTENAKLLGATTIYTAGQITELQTVLARRGFGEDQILQMTKGIANLATATGTDLAVAAELAGSTMQAFGMKASQMDRIVSALGVSTTKSALTTDKLQTSLAYVAPAARAAGFNLEETIAMLGALADSGIPATTAGVAVRNILVHLSTDASKLSKAIGHPVRNLKEFTEALTDLNARGYNDLNHISKLVEKRIIPGFSIFMNNADKLNELRDSIVGVEDELQKMADEQLNTVRGSLTLLQSAWDGLMLTFAENNGPLKHDLDLITQLVNKMIEYRKLDQGGAAALSVLRQSEQADYTEEAKKLISNMRGSTSDEEQITKSLTRDVDVFSDEIKQMTEDLKTGQKYVDLLRNGYNPGVAQQSENWGYDMEVNYGVGSVAQLEKKIIEVERELNIRNAALQLLAEGDPNKVVDGGEDDPSDLTPKKETPKEKAEKKVAKALEDYSVTIQLATIEKEQGLIDEKKFLQRQLSAQETLFKAYAGADILYPKKEYKDALSQWAEKIRTNATTIADMTVEEERLKEEERERQRQIRAMRQVDTHTLNGLISVAKGASDRIGDANPLEYFGLSGIKSRMAASPVLDITDEEWKELEDEINKKLESLNLAKIKIDVETGTVSKMADEVKIMGESWKYAQKAISSVGSALNSIENPAAKVIGIIAEAIANVAAGYGEAVAQKGKEWEPWSWIAFTAAAGATMVGAIASIKSATEYHADGGFVGMNGLKRGTDIVPAMLTPGELVLNAAQQSALAGQLQGGYGNLHIEKVIDAEEIRLILTNNNRRRHRGDRAITL